MSRVSLPRRRRKTLTMFTSTKVKRDPQQIWKSLLWLVLGLVTVASLLVAGQFAWEVVANQAVYENPRFTLKNIVIKSGSIPRTQVLRAARLAPGLKLMTLDLVQIQRDLQRLPYVAESEIRRQVPDTLVIMIRERIPILRVLVIGGEVSRTETYYLDREGVMLKPRPGEAIAALPQVTGLRPAELEAGQRIDNAGLRAAIDLVEMLEQTSLHVPFDITEIDVSRSFAMKVHTRQGAWITFRLEYLDQQLSRLAEIFDNAVSRNRDIATIDLTPDKNVPVTFVN